MTPARRRIPRTTGRLGLLATLCALMACQTPQWPVRGPLASPYGIRMRGALPGVHRGVDITAPEGTPVRPLLDGRVRFAGTMSGYGQVIWVDHDDNLLSVYAHLSEMLVTAGQAVARSTVIARTGQSGNAQGPHLHLEIWRWGREVDPVQFLGGPPRGGGAP